MPYDFNQHRHNFAVWTAARAVSRDFTTTSKIKKAIEASELRGFAETHTNLKKNEFGLLHRKWSRQLANSFEEQGVPVVSYGRTAKIISIYLKTSVILCNKVGCIRSLIIHPPIDSILLNRISKMQGLSNLKNLRWTLLDEKTYWELASTIETHFGKFDWTLEEYWSPERK